MIKNVIFDTDEYVALFKVDKTLTKIVDWIESNPQNFLDKSQDQICKLLDVSQPTISRIVKKMGFNTFREVQIFVAKKMQEIAPEFELSLKETKEIVNIRYNVFQQYSNLIKIVYSSIDDEVLENISVDIISSDHVFFIGIGTNAITSNYYAEKLRSLGISATSISNIHQFVDEIEGFDKKHTHYVLISKTIKAKEIRSMLQILSKNNKEFSVITANKNFRFLSCKNLLVYDYFKEKSFTFDIAKKIAVNMIMDILYFRIISKIDPNLVNFEHQKELIEKWNY